MLIIGLTGGIGSGKSTVARLFADKGIPVLDADIIARNLTQPGEPALVAIVEHFGIHVLHKDGNLNRAKLRDFIFQNPAERRWLEQLLHPLIRDKLSQELAGISASGNKAPYCIIVIPLLLETEAYPFIDRILVVDAPEHLQIERVSIRDSTLAANAKAIVSTQLDRQERLKRADDVIINDSTQAALGPQVDKLHNEYAKKVLH
jgi:dephospho-CoA kinase